MMSRNNKCLVLIAVISVVFVAVYGGLIRRGNAGAAILSDSSEIPETHTSDFESSETKVSSDFGSLPLHFAAHGKAEDDDRTFYSAGSGYGLSLSRGGAMLRLVTARKPGEVEESGSLVANEVNLSFAGGNLHSPLGEKMLEGKVNYLIGNDPEKWEANNPTFEKVRYTSVYPGIDTVFYGNQRELEYDFVVAPKADPKLIGMEFSGAEKLSIDKRGDLLIGLKNGIIRQRRPIAYQTIDGKREPVKVKFVQRSDSRIAFSLGKYDSTRELTIDPVIVFSSFWGGSSGDIPGGVTTDSEGNIYLAGSTGSVNFPTVNPLQPQINDNQFLDAFVTKINPAGNAVIYSTYLGGSFEDAAFSVSVDSNGNAVVAGRTSSLNFPTASALQPQLAGNADGFVSKLNANGSALIYSTYLGGFGFEEIRAATVDASGRTVIAGRTDSSDYPTVAPIQPNILGSAFFRSNNAGTSFTPALLAPGVNNVSSISSPASSPNVVYAGTNRGVYKSVDGGTNWSPAGQATLSFTVSKIAAARSNANIVYAIGLNTIFKSDDGGNTWTNVLGTINSPLSSVAVDPADPNRVFVGGFSGSIFRSSDGAATWTNTSITNVFNTVNSLLVDPANPQIVYAGTTQRIYKSTVGGGSWVVSTNGIPSLQNFSELLIDSSTGAIYAAGPFALYRSVNGAANWAAIVPGVGGTVSVAQDPSNALNLFYAGGTRLYRSADGGSTFTVVTDGLSPTSLTSVAVSANSVLAGGYAGTDAFVSRLSASGNALDFSTFFGGAQNDWAFGVDIGGDGRIVFAGTTQSPGFPMINASQSVFGGSLTDSFAVKLSTNESGVVFSTFLGGSSNENAAAVAVGVDGAVYVTGSTNSVNFPLAAPLQPTCGSCASLINDAFLTKIGSNGGPFVFSTFLGGSQSDNGLAVAVDSQNRALVAGSTGSANFPVLDPIQATYAGGTDGFVSQIKSDGTGFLYSTFFGGSSTDSVLALTIAPEGNAVIFGQTSSINLPVVQPLRNQLGGGTDTFFAKIGSAADVGVVATEERDPVMINNPVKLKFQISNTGPQTSTGVVFTQIIPPGVNFVSASPSQGSCAATSTAVSCTIGTILLNGSVAIDVVVTPTAGTSVTTTASVTADVPDQNPANNTVAETTAISLRPSIFGRITTASLQPAAGVDVLLSGLENRNGTSSATGTYGFSELPLAGNYTVRPVKAGFYFSPRSKSFGSLTADGTADFVMNSCSYSLSPGAANYPANGGSGAIQVLTNDPFCSWAAVSNVPWITITSVASGFGNGTVRISVAPSSAPRSGSVTIGGQIFTVTQAGCSFSISSTQQSLLQTGGNGTLSITSNPGFCQWAATASDSWISIVGISTGTGNATINFSVAPTTVPRSGRITVGGKIFVVYQEANYCATPSLAAPVNTLATTDSFDIVSGFFNNDLLPDLATVDSSANQSATYSTYSNSGNGTFVRNTIPVSSGTLVAITAGFFNADSNLDLAFNSQNGVIIYHGNGANSFLPQASFPASGAVGPESFHTEDFNRDGKADLLLAANNRIQVFSGNGDGTFTESFLLNFTGRRPYSASFGDVNGDGVTDVVFGQDRDFIGPELAYFFGTVNGTFAAGGVVSLSTTPFKLELADLNGDGRADVVTSGFSNSQLFLFLWNPETNSFGSARRIFFDPGFTFLWKVVDFDNDGKPDIVSNGSVILRGNGNGTFKLPIVSPAVNGANSLITVDLNNDGRKDLAFSKLGGQMSTQLNQCTATAGTRVPMATKFDFDGDRKADVAVVRPADNTWYLRPEGKQRPWYAQAFGQSGDRYVPADYDGDGKTDIAVFRPAEGMWYRKNSSDDTISINKWGSAGDIPVASDFDGDERADLAVFRPGENNWYWLSSLSEQVHVVPFGLSDDVPVVADYDGDGKSDIAVFRPSDGNWYWQPSNGGEMRTYKFGVGGDVTAPGDYDGDGRSDYAVFRPSSGEWFIAASAQTSPMVVRYGMKGDVPSPADYDGDGKTDIAVFRNGVWYIANSSSGANEIVFFGLQGDKPVPATGLR